MSTTSSAFALSNATNSERRAPPPPSKDGYGARPRVPSALGTERSMRGTQSPQSLAHSILHRKAASESRPGSSDTGFLGERRTERSHVAILDTVTVRTRSPATELEDGHLQGRHIRGSHRGNSGSRVETTRPPIGQRREREAPQG